MADASVNVIARSMNIIDAMHGGGCRHQLHQPAGTGT